MKLERWYKAKIAKTDDDNTTTTTTTTTATTNNNKDTNNNDSLRPFLYSRFQSLDFEQTQLNIAFKAF